MPLDFIELVGENIHLAVWEIAESEISLQEKCNLSNEDQQLLQTIHHSEKRLEFLAGRVLVESSLKILGVNFKGLYRNDYGKPELKDSAYQVSLSHTEDYVVVLLGENRNVGIDIEKPQEKMRKIASRLYNEEELFICGDDLDLISKIWSAKEVLFKLYMRGGIDFRKHLMIEGFTDDFKFCEGTILKDNLNQTYPLTFKKYNQYFICFNIK